MQPSRIGQLDRAPAQEVERPGMRRSRRGMVARMDRREPTPVAIQDEPGQRIAAGPAGARLEIDEVTGGEGGAPPVDERRPAARTRSGAARRSRAAGRRSGRGPTRAARSGRTKPSPAPSGPAGRRGGRRRRRRASAAADPLAGRLGDAVEHGRPRRHRAERQRDPVARRLDLLDRRGSRRPRSRHGTASPTRAPPGPRRRRRSPRPPAHRRSPISRAASGRCVGADRDRPARQVGAAAADTAAIPASARGPGRRRRPRGTAASSRTRARCSAQARDW